MSDPWTYEYAYPIHAQADRIFAALTDSDDLMTWCAEHARVEPEVGGRFDFWGRRTLGNLTAHTAAHGDVLVVDFEDPSPEIKLSMDMEATPEKVFRALTEPEALNQWMAPGAHVDLREGGRYDLGFTPEGYDGPSMRILELVPNEKLVISWPDWRGDTFVPVQSVSWLLEPSGDGTRVTVIHSGFVRTVDLSDYPFGWRYFLGRLESVAEGLQDRWRTGGAARVGRAMAPAPRRAAPGSVVRR